MQGRRRTSIWLNSKIQQIQIKFVKIFTHRVLQVTRNICYFSKSLPWEEYFIFWFQRCDTNLFSHTIHDLFLQFVRWSNTFYQGHVCIDALSFDLRITQRFLLSEIEQMMIIARKISDKDPHQNQSACIMK